MRTKFLFMLCSFMMLFFTLSSFKTEAPLNEVQFIIQDSKEVDAVYGGYDGSAYSFTAQSNGETYKLLFQSVEDAVLSDFDLSSDTLVGVVFKVTYTTEIAVTKDADGNDVETEVNTITKLEKL
ncbi:hypothetical protein Q4Q34_10880 [Flavivirga abyssicola]|uniref:hypothetical protein n=1 Tax=Flavivirga abyssicola TaxID=3063533 RepID=UPI0026DF9E7A|nr:hypothetical protein [Flavivirga sp. MEBiC07777]WVK11728.1 hypothetical protein Q4Q34_10880 [Flavivirga sp. MEBiC07777]